MPHIQLSLFVTTWTLRVNPIKFLGASFVIATAILATLLFFVAGINYLLQRLQEAMGAPQHAHVSSGGSFVLFIFTLIATIKAWGWCNTLTTAVDASVDFQFRFLAGWMTGLTVFLGSGVPVLLALSAVAAFKVATEANPES